MLDTNMSTCAGPRALEKQDRLNTLIQAMKEYRPQYEAVDWVCRTIRYIWDGTCLDEPMRSWQDATQLSRVISLGEHREDDKTDILRRSPTRYLKMALAIDLSLRLGRLPEETDIPVKLRSLLLRETRNIMPVSFRLDHEQGGGHTDDIAEEEEWESIADPGYLYRQLAAQDLQTMAGWIRNDRSLHLAQELGLGMSELDSRGLA